MSLSPHDWRSELFWAANKRPSEVKSALQFGGRLHMRSLPVTLVAAMACTVGAERSSAADLPVTEEQAVEFVQLTWAGFYIGSQIGVIAEDNDRSFPIGPFVQLPVTPFGGIGGATGAVNGDIEGPELFGGLHAGYNW